MEDRMIIHHREFAYSNDYQQFFESLVKAKVHMEKRFPEVSVQLMYNLAGPRGYATIQTCYPSLADYERIDAEMDLDEEYMAILEDIIRNAGQLPVDQFFRTID